MSRLHKTGMVILLSLLFAAMLWAKHSAIQDLFRQGNGFFQKGQYQQAIVIYQKILNEGYESGELYYNLGNAYFKIGQLGKARLYYEKAARLMPDDEALKENLLILQSRLIDKIEKPPKFILSVWWQALLNLFSIDVLAWLVVAFFWFAVFSIAFNLYWKKQKRQQRGRFLVMMSVFFLLVSGLLFAEKVYRFENEKYGVILKPSVTVHSEPRQGATEIFVIHEGTKVEILRKNNDWLEIKLEDGKTGWLPQNALEII